MSYTDLLKHILQMQFNFLHFIDFNILQVMKPFRIQRLFQILIS